jgi:threonine dehydrogenase-like Zn-dependent dehydrogenase
MNRTAAAPARETTAKTKQNRAAVIRSPGHIDISFTAIPRVGPREILVRMEGCGLCASNLPVWEGRPWFEYPREAGAPGHEGWGVVDRIGEDVLEISPGDRVALLSYHAFATYDIASAGNAVRIPPELENRPFPGEPLGCAVNVIRRSGLHEGQTVAIVGIGFLGALLVALAANAGANVIAIARRPCALDIARQQGAIQAIPMHDHNRVVEEVKDLTGGIGCECVIEAVGAQWPLDLAGELVAERGRLVIAGYHQDGPRQVNMQLWNWRGIDVVNAHERDTATYMSGMWEAIRLIVSGKLNPDPLYTHRLPLENLQDAFTLMEERPEGFLKALITM